MTNDIPQARAIILRHGWNTTSYQILNPGLTRWYSRRLDAVVGYVETHRTRVVAGAPICAKSDLPGVASEFEYESERQGMRVCYFAAEGRLQTVLAASPSAYSRLILGAQPSWHPEALVAAIHGHASLRAQLHRAHNKGVEVHEWPSNQAEGNPELRQCLAAWLESRGLPTLRFLVEPHTLGMLLDRHIFVATRHSAVIGFTVISPIAARQGWLIEQFVRHPLAPNGTAEVMIDAAAQWMASHHATYVTLGLAPLSQHVATKVPETPVWIDALFIWARAHGRRFYNFDGLDAFKAKFQPQCWEPVYAISHEHQFSARSLYAIAAAFTGGQPFRTVAGGLAKAAKREWEWLVDTKRERLSAPART